MEEWDWKALCNQFRSIEQQAFQEMSEVEKKIPDDPSCEALYDLHLAKFCLFGRLHSTNLPYTRKIFLIYLRSLLENPIIGRADPYDHGRYLECWNQYITSLLKEFSTPEDE